MNSKLKIIIVILSLLLAVVIYLDYTKPKPVNWTPTYAVKDKFPLGLYVFDHEITALLSNNKIIKILKTPYEFLQPQYNNDPSVKEYSCKGTLFFINHNYTIDDQSTQEILSFVSKGNTAFISATEFSSKLLDSLHVKTAPQFKISDKNEVWLSEKPFKNRKTNLNIGASATSFTVIDTATTTVLGYQGNDSVKDANFIKVPYFKGNFYLHLQPASFSNYHLLKSNNYIYSQNIVSYLPKNNFYWILNKQNTTEISNSPLRFVFSQPALKWAWLLFVFGILFFMIFNAKRKQRIIPIIYPVQNSTVDFTKTIGNLYYQEANHQDIIHKKIVYFLQKIRSDYALDTSTLDDKFCEKYHLKSGKNKADVKIAVQLINYHRQQLHQSVEADVVQLNKAIEKII